MSSFLTTYTKNAVINHLFRTTKFTAPSIIYAALYTAAPTVSGGGTEVSAGGYARVAVNVTDSNFDAPSTGATQNAVAITFPPPSATWGTIVAMGFFDASSGGNLLMAGDLTVSKVVNNGDGAPSFAIGDFDFTFP